MRDGQCDAAQNAQTMIEIKDGSLAIEGRRLFNRLSFSVGNGRIVGVTGAKGCGTTALIECFLCMRRLDEGFISIDGEPLLPATKDLFRGDMAYLPQAVRMPCEKASGLFDSVIGLRTNGNLEFPKKKLLLEWRKLGISPSLYNSPTESLDDSQLRLMALGAAGMMCRPIALLDSPTLALDAPTADLAAEYIEALANDGAAVMVATRSRQMLAKCDDVIVLDADKAA